MRGLDANVMAQMKQVAVTRVTHCDPVVPPKWDLSPQMHPDQKLNGFEELSSTKISSFFTFFLRACISLKELIEEFYLDLSKLLRNL